MEQGKEYYAFISYKREDEKWAKWVQDKLEHYKFPTNLNGRTDLPKNIRPTFRDVTDLKPGLLAEEINNALCNSEWLIVVCSPRSAKSPWVCKEAQTFIDLGRADHIIPFVIEGNPFSNDAATECYPEALLKLTGSKELLAANINEMGRDAAAIKVVARMFNLRFDSLWQRYERERRYHRNIAIFLGLSILIAILGVAGFILMQNITLKQVISRAAANTANELTDEGDCYMSRKIAVSALDMSYTPEAEASLRKAIQTDNAILYGHNSEVVSADYSPDGKYIVSASSDKTIRIWGVADGRCIKVLAGHKESVSSVMYNSTGKQIVSSSLDGTIRIWDAITGECMRDLKVDTMGVTKAVFSPNDQYIVCSSYSSYVRIWNNNAKKWQSKIKGDWGSVLSVSFSPDNNLISTVSADDVIRIWDVESGKCLQSFYAGHKNIASAIFSPNGEQIAISSGDGIVSIWDIASCQWVMTLHGPEFNVTSADYNSDGSLLVCSSLDENIYIYGKWNRGNS